MTNGSKRPRGTTGLYLSVAVAASSIALVSLLVLHWCCLPHCAGIFARHHSCHCIFFVPGLIVIDCIDQRCCLGQSTPALHWRLFWHCAGGVVSLIALASLHNTVVVPASLLYPASLSSTGSADVVVWSGCRQHHTGIFAVVVLALSFSLRWCLCATP
jgi:hypothetical protein